MIDLWFSLSRENLEALIGNTAGNGILEALVVIHDSFGNVAQVSSAKLFQQLSHILQAPTSFQDMLEQTVQTVGPALGLDRTLVGLYDDRQQEVGIAAEYRCEPLKTLRGRHYQLPADSQWRRYLEQGRPLPLKEIQPETAGHADSRGLNSFIRDSNGESLLAFPLLEGGRLHGILSMHHADQNKCFGDEEIELGEAIAEMLALAIRQAWTMQEKEVAVQVFRDSSEALMILDQQSFRILKCNQAACKLFAIEDELSQDWFLPDLLPGLDSRKLKQMVGRIGEALPVVTLDDLIISTAGSLPSRYLAVLSKLKFNGEPVIFLTLVPQFTPESKAALKTATEALSEHPEEMAAVLSRQLNRERQLRHIITGIHSSLDRDAVLQVAADSLGRILNLSRCLIVRTAGPVSPVVTHEYVEPDISPLGLGRTSQFPLRVVSYFRHKAECWTDVTVESETTNLTRQDCTDLLENGIRALMGSPISYQGMNYGVVIAVQTDNPRQWSPQDVEMLEIVSQQAAIALDHAQSFSQVKDQLFNLNLVGNLAQQLTNALDSATRLSKTEPGADSAGQSKVTTPLSLRELEVLKLIASGLANREIAHKLFLTESTVELHASRIRKKLKLKSRTALVKYACDNHLV